jgi:hypothetical protein
MSYKKITSWEAAAKRVGVDPNALPDVSMLPERLHAFTIGNYKRAIVVEALNKAYNPKLPRWIPNFKDSSQLKFYPYVWPGEDEAVASGFGFRHTAYDYTRTHSDVSARLLLRDSDLIEHMYTHFRQLLVDTMLIPLDEQ